MNTVSSALVFPTDLNIWVKAGLSQTLPVLARLEADLVHSWSEAVTGYQSWTASVLVRVSGIISDTLINIMTFIFQGFDFYTSQSFDGNRFQNTVTINFFFFGPSEDLTTQVMSTELSISISMLARVTRRDAPVF